MRAVKAVDAGRAEVIETPDGPLGQPQRGQCLVQAPTPLRRTLVPEAGVHEGVAVSRKPQPMERP